MDRSKAGAVASALKVSERGRQIDDEVFKLALGLPPDSIKLTAGEPDFSTSDFVNQAAIQAMAKGLTHYTSSNGIPQLREAISRKLREDNNLSYDPDEIVVSPGSSSSIFLLLFALADRGDEILIPDPAWFHYAILSELAGLRPVRVPQRKEAGFRLSTDDMERKVTRKTRLMIINTPSNPTGHVMTRDELEEIAGVAERHNITVISDEIYEKILYENSRHVSIGSLPGMKERTVTVNGLSKGYAMMGWRIGYSASSSELAEKMTSLLGYTLVCAGSVAQYAAVEALTNPKSKDYVRKMVRTWSKRREIVMKHVNENPSLMSAVAPQGAFYGWIDVSPSGMTGGEVSSGLLKEYNVGVMPGHLFGESGVGHIRISFATSDDAVDEGMKRLAKFLQKHRK